MNTTYLTIAIPASSALLYFTYKHPEYGRKILYLIYAIVWLVYLLNFSYGGGASKAYNKSQIAVLKSEHKLKYEKDFKSTDAIAKAANDSLLIADLRTMEYDQQIKQQISKGIDVIKDETEKNVNSITLYSVITFVIISIIFFLSFLFDKIIYDDNVKKNNDS